MKKIIFIFALSATFFSCSKDEDPTCSVSDFVGVWTVEGGDACILGDTNTLTLTDLGNNKIQPVYTGGGVTSDFTSWTVNNCGFTGKVEDSGFDININITGKLANGKLTITNNGNFGGIPINCTENFTK